MTRTRKLTIYLMRHGHCEGGELLRGRTDVPLSPAGLEQMWEAWRSISDDIDGARLTLLSSPLRRCTKFAQGIADDMGEFFEMPLQIAPWLAELNFGEWDGLPFAELEACHGEELMAFWQDPLDITPPGGEPVREFHQRVVAGWHSLHQRMLKSDKDTALLVTHGGVIRSLMNEVLCPDTLPAAGLFTAFDLPYGSIMKISVFANEIDGEWQCSSRLHWTF
ncbi:histidine phosphatase family protein [Shewanella sp. A3A]|uniref:phosphoglycerate mutase (2,3-diphosphoglycerate-dependent) n=2 Tax=Bacteria TaxID=2 RepID=A0ABT2FLA4_9GAMM|nr:histidine phosphatase family protein [Shewanella electrica]MCH1920778.1 histidine phosphatase family protein [Shewanella ferrihydritica]MCH1925579.1 histidine phosphatase family protein [Shewanella electrica]MCS4557114.1 histidine phosphatase family protein [Shewanella electrica]